MKTKELMISNVVEINGEPQRLRHISRRKVGYCPMGSPNRRYAHISEIKPRPITEELLLKNGFADDTGTLCFKYYCLNMEHHTVTVRGISNTPGRDWSVRIANNDTQTVASADVQHLHQLQNILNIMDIKLDLVV